MRGARFLSGLLTTTVFVSSVFADLDPIVVKGTKFFFKSNGTEFFIRGIAYQQEAGGNGTVGVSSSSSGAAAYKDPLADQDRCKVDIPLMARLRTNAIRVYAVDPKQDHSVCMQLLQDNGIYIIADLSEPGLSINRDTPAWNDELYIRYTAVVDIFSKYSNVIGFFAGNEVSNQKNNTAASAFVKAAVRDTKAYIKAKGYRPMYVGYATSDDADIRENMANYFNCGNQDDAIDFWGYNIYSWCGDSSFTQSGFDQRVKEFASYSVPSFFAEYGCNTIRPRNFTEVGALYGNQMTPVFSGGIVYMYFEEANKYGLVDISSGTASPLPDYTNLARQMASIAPTGVQMNNYNPTNSPQACPSVVNGIWAAKSSPLPPSPNPGLCQCMYNSLSCAVKNTVKQESYDKLFGTVCGFGGGSACAGIGANATTGVYGAYSMCNDTEKLSFVFDQYYKSQNNQQTACNFQGAAAIKSSIQPPPSCTALMKEAGPAGTGTVSSGPNISGAGSGSGSGKKGAGSVNSPNLDLGLFIMGAYVAIAGLFGAGLVLL